MNDPISLLQTVSDDVQARRPAASVSLSRVGITGVQKVIRIRAGQSDEQLFYAELECFVDLPPSQKGAHMSRFEEVVEEAIDEVVLSEALKAETLAAHIAERVRERQQALRAEVTVAARYPEHKVAPSSGLRTQTIYTLFGSAVASAAGTRRLVGVQAQGMTACPCAQELLTSRARERLQDDDFSDDEIERIFEHVPVATHNQRGLGTLYVGCPETCADPIDAAVLLRIVESSMSAPVYALLKRPDELFVVEHAHLQPRFVEDSVRIALATTVERFPELDDSDFLYSRQVNLETIHSHDVLAERFGTVGEVRAELDDGTTPERHTSLGDWLRG